MDTHMDIARLTFGIALLVEDDLAECPAIGFLTTIIRNYWTGELDLTGPRWDFGGNLR